MEKGVVLQSKKTSSSSAFVKHQEGKEKVVLSKEDLESFSSVVLTDSEGQPYCLIYDCDEIALVEGHCRYHYLLLWKKIRLRQNILEGDKFFKCIAEFTSKYSLNLLEKIFDDLKSEKDFQLFFEDMEEKKGNHRITSSIYGEKEEGVQSYAEED